MSRRHIMRRNDWDSVFGSLQELVLANSGEDDFQEIFKLVLAKVYAEAAPEFRADFRPCMINDLLKGASQRWPGILPDAPVSRLTSEHLAVCVTALAEHRLFDAHLEALDGVFEVLINRASKGSKGQFFTPRHVIDCCVRIVDPDAGETVLDPACGSAGFLIHTLHHQPRTQVWGCDLDARAIQVARALMLIAGAGADHISRLNSLMLPENESQATIEEMLCAPVDVILTNPPFAGEIREPDLLDKYELGLARRRVERDVLFLERCVRLLRPGGRLAIVLPHNKLGGAACAYVREWLLRQVRVVAVLGLGRHTFLPHTHQKSAVVFAVKRRQPGVCPRETVLFLISEKDGKNSRGQIVTRPGACLEAPAWQRADHDLDVLVERFHEHLHSGKISWEAR